MTIDFSKTTETVPTPVEGVVGNDGACAAVGSPHSREYPAGAIGAPHPQNVQVFNQADEAPRRDQIIFPRLNIVQGSGGLKDSFSIGSLVYAQSLVLFQPTVVNAKTGAVDSQGTPPVTITALKLFPERFIEKVEGGIGGRIVNTEEAVRNAGGTLSYQEFKAKESSGIKRFGPMLDVLLAIARPDAVADDDTVFIYPVDGRKYAVALWSLTWSAYTATAKGVLYTQKAMGCLNKGYNTHSFSLSTRTAVDKRTGNTYYVPVLIPHKPSTPAFLEFASEVVASLG